MIKLLTELVGDGLNNFILGEVSELNIKENDTFDDNINEDTHRGASSWLAGLDD